MPLGNMVLDGPEAFRADHMFNAAGILRGCLFIHPRYMSHWESMVWRSYMVSAISFPMLLRVMCPWSSMRI